MKFLLKRRAQKEEKVVATPPVTSPEPLVRSQSSTSSLSGGSSGQHSRVSLLARSSGGESRQDLPKEGAAGSCLPTSTTDSAVQDTGTFINLSSARQLSSPGLVTGTGSFAGVLPTPSRTPSPHRSASVPSRRWMSSSSGSASSSLAMTDAPAGLPVTRASGAGTSLVSSTPLSSLTSRLSKMSSQGPVEAFPESVTASQERSHSRRSVSTCPVSPTSSQKSFASVHSGALTNSEGFSTAHQTRLSTSSPPVGDEDVACIPLEDSSNCYSHGSDTATTVDRSGSSEQHSNPFAAFPPLQDASDSEASSLFLKKLSACCTVYNFADADSCLAAKEGKRLALVELVDYINNTKNCFTDPAIKAIVDMISANIFRPLPASSTAPLQMGNVLEAEDEEPTWESAWPHLQLVYEIFLRFIVSNEVDPKAVKRHIDQRFILKLLDLFSSEDPRERDYLKTILHRIYGKIMALRSFIRKSIQHTFFFFVEEQDTHRGIAELLEILGSIINGFARPLKEEHKVFLEKSLIPLHKSRCLGSFTQQLTYCMAQYLEKDETLVEVVIMGLLKFWPATNTSKEVVFLHEIEELLEYAQPDEFRKIMCPLFRQIAQCIQSPHFQVAERVLFMWNNEYIVDLFNSNRQQLFPIVISALYRNSKDHWNSTVHGLTYNVSKLLAEVDPKLFDECSVRNLTLEEQLATERNERKSKWEALEAGFRQQKTSDCVS